jgi:ATP-dependent RNA helicase DHR2
LKNLISGVEQGPKRKHPLKVVVMSATADVEALVNFFDGDSNSADGNGKRLAESDDKGSEGSWSGISSDAEPSDQGTPKVGTSSSSQIAKCFVEGRQYPVKTTYLPEPTQDWVEAALKLIFQIHYREPLPGDILVFLTGQDTIESLEKLVNDYAQGMDKDVPKLLCLPLFAALPQHAQQLIFTPTPPRTRKIILATNIAETSVTVPGVRFVIDSGKSKIKQFRNRLGLESLLVKPISKSAAIQRRGRAGREAPGQCYRLYTEEGYEAMEERTIPEILRCDLSHAILTMKARGVDDVVNFPFLDRPYREALEKALLQLLHLGCLNENGSISDLGLKVAKLPLTPTLGRVLVEAARPERDCLTEVIDIISALSVENVFLNLVTEERKEEAEAARRELYRREGDHMTLLVTVQRFAEENSDRKAWCERHFVSHRAMQNVMVCSLHFISFPCSPSSTVSLGSMVRVRLLTYAAEYKKTTPLPIPIPPPPPLLHLIHPLLRPLHPLIPPHLNHTPLIILIPNSNPIHPKLPPPRLHFQHSPPHARRQLQNAHGQPDRRHTPQLCAFRTQDGSYCVLRVCVYGQGVGEGR